MISGVNEAISVPSGSVKQAKLLRLLNSNSLTARVTGNRGARPEGNGSTQHLMQMTGRRAARESFLAPNNCTTSSRVSRAKAVGTECGRVQRETNQVPHDVD
ncbi:hypothetical protein TGGT1_244930B [Toxoplasma gondii GT1]|uniref:Uncharacterized protein n=2 Tax=Toxoplasma gondii (strain ATCC 50853 / GT1) TaxID=507601 RepID=S7UGB1_TOXGG|nr:hypothetical protein TGGT1_244930B [Toxoplasma gondii GT1]